MFKKILKFCYAIYSLIGRCYLAPMLLYEWKRPPFREINERAFEYGFVLKWLIKLCPNSVLDVGSGKSSWPHIMANCGFSVTAIDKISGYWKTGFLNRHYHIINDDITEPNITKKFDAITCISVLEHIPDHNSAIKGMFHLLKPGGYLLLTIPYNEKQYIDNVYKLPNAGYGRNYGYICQVYSRKEIDGWLTKNQGKIIEQEYYEIFSGELWTFGERICPPRQVIGEEKCHLTCIVLQKDRGTS